MKRKIKKLWTNIQNRIRRRNNYVYPLKVPLAGIRKEQIRIDRESGVLYVDAEQQIVIEEADRFRPSKMYSSFGFYRSIFLPEGISIDEIDTRIFTDHLTIGWPKKFNQ